MTRARNPLLARFGSIRPGSVIYVAELGSSVVKVGRTLTCARRLRELHLQFWRQGMGVGRYETFPVVEKRLLIAENGCIRRLRAIAQGLPNSHEYFTGITFDEAVAVVRSVVSGVGTAHRDMVDQSPPSGISLTVDSELPIQHATEVMA